MRLRLREGVSATDTEYGSILLDERSGDYFQLNATGTLVVRLLLADRSPAEAADALAEEFGVDRSRALADVTALTAALQEARLVAVTRE
jgi:hypothetical protein